MVETDRLLGAFGNARVLGTREPVGLRRTTMSVYETQAEGRTDTEHATIVEDGPRWKGPFTEHEGVIEQFAYQRAG